MYPYLEPHGLIMKINRQPMAQLPAETLAQDHEYWRKVVRGMMGDWLDDQTTVSQLVEFVDRVYVRKNFKGFTGDPDFVQNACANQEFSKLRSAIAGAYAWRLGPGAPQRYRPKTQADRQALAKEADFAFRQAFVLCPYSPEAIFRYVQLLLQMQRFDDARLVAEAALKADPKNGQVQSLLDSINSYKRQQAKAISADLPNSSVFQARLVAGDSPGVSAPGNLDEVSRTNVTATGQARVERLFVDRKVILDQKDLKTTKVVAGHPAGQFEISMTFTDEGRKHLAKVTRQNIGNRLALIINGRLCSAPVIRTELSSGELPVSGDFSEQEAENLSKRINEALKK
jgi:hypothetical protein